MRRKSTREKALPANLRDRGPKSTGANLALLPSKTAWA